MLFALPAGLLLLASWRTRFFAAGDDGWRLPRWGEVLLYASMPVFHLHTFIFLSLMLGSWFVLHASARRGVAAARRPGASCPPRRWSFWSPDRLRGASVHRLETRLDVGRRHVAEMVRDASARHAAS